ncbi:MAG: hypothetical protein AB7S56_07510 [Halothiobacillaceae bacterium]
MKTMQRRLVLGSAVIAALGMSHSVLAESQYGYNAAGTGTLTAQARLNVEVKVPKMILLRVGSSGNTPDTVTLQGGFAGGIPGGVATLTDGNNQATGWDGTAPIQTLTSTPASVQAYAWTNAAGGGELGGVATLTAGTPSTGVALTQIEVTSTVVSGGGLAHPGANLGTLANVTFARNAVQSSTWAFNISAANLAGLASGSDSVAITYTATTL